MCCYVMSNMLRIFNVLQKPYSALHYNERAVSTVSHTLAWGLEGLLGVGFAQDRSNPFLVNLYHTHIVYFCVWTDWCNV